MVVRSVRYDVPTEQMQPRAPSERLVSSTHRWYRYGYGLAYALISFVRLICYLPVRTTLSPNL